MRGSSYCVAVRTKASTYEGLGLRHRETDQHGTFEPSGDDRNAAENPSQGRDAGAPGEASER